MTVFQAVSLVNVMASLGALTLAAIALSKTENHLLRQVLVTPVFLLIGLVVMHTTEVIGGAGHGIHDIGAAAWRMLDFLALVVIARLVHAVWRGKGD